MRRADKLRARFVAVIGDDELARGAATLRNMSSRDERAVALSVEALGQALRASGAGAP